MDNFTQISQFNFPTTVRFGKDVIKELGPHLHELGYERPLVVTDPVLKTLPVFEGFLMLLDQAKLDCSVYSGIDKNPVASNVENGAQFYKDNSCDCIIGFGGGASMDVARTIALRVNHGGDLEKYRDDLGGDKLIVNEIPYFVTVPTTSGTGSEVGRSSVIANDETHQKFIYFHPNLIAKKVFADPVLTMNLPPKVTAATGVDALTHNIEAYFAKGFHPMCDGIALEGIKLCGEALREATLNPTLEVRSKMMAAALMGAVAFQKGLGVIHSLAHSLSAHFDLHHGLANAIMLPYGVAFNGEAVPERVHQMCRALKIEESVESLVEYLFKLNDDLSIPRTLESFGIKESDLAALTKTAYEDGCHQSNPRTCSQEDLLKLFKEALC